jgi:hypothetical protein
VPDEVGLGGLHADQRVEQVDPQAPVLGQQERRRARDQLIGVAQPADHGGLGVGVDAGEPAEPLVERAVPLTARA